MKPLDIPEVSPIGAVAEFLSPILQKIRATRAGNEQSEFLGSVSIAQERAAAAIADNPGMPFEDMNKIQEQMMKEIGKAGENLTLPESKNYARNFTLKNKQLINEKFNTQKEAILTRHEMTRFNLERERLITERKPDELKKLYASQSGKLLDPEVAKLAYENDLLEIEDLQKRYDVEVAKAGHSSLLEQFAEAGRGMELKEATDFFNKISREIITEPERRSLIAQRETQENKKESESESQSEAVIKSGYKYIIGGGENIGNIANIILADPTMTDEDKTIAIDKVKSFFTTWNSAIKKEGEDIVTSNSTRIKALRIIKAVKTGKFTEDRGIEVYGTLSKIEKINGTDGKQFINDIFAAGEAASNVERKRQNDILAGREKQLRDAIEKQQNILQPDLATEILKDFANIAVIELNDAFREGDFTKEEVDIEIDRLLKRFTLSEVQQQMAVNARTLRLAESLKEQQESVTEVITSLREQGKEDEAKRVMDDAIRLGIFLDEGGTIKKGKKKASVGKELIKRILDSIVE